MKQVPTEALGSIKKLKYNSEMTEIEKRLVKCREILKYC